ncbi:hypothetical protein SO694_00149021 [Aureococcus anophagefferens]|uniref:PTM/DIR17-like Tudor domain-containing protein n=1 Tax=Aureococcus anophagefferens TaxID=44056 RepID=A0ABR1FNG2_AURAN
MAKPGGNKRAAKKASAAQKKPAATKPAAKKAAKPAARTAGSATKPAGRSPRQTERDWHAAAALQRAYIGRKVKKEFVSDNGFMKFFAGEVVDYDDKKKWFRVLYEDDDEEDMNETELLRILVADARPPPAYPQHALLPRDSDASASRPTATTLALGGFEVLPADAAGAPAVDDPPSPDGSNASNETWTPNEKYIGSHGRSLPSASSSTARRRSVTSSPTRRARARTSSAAPPAGAPRLRLRPPQIPPWTR